MKKILQKFSLYPDKTDIKSLVLSFLIINFAFLYHTLNFMWGNHDVVFIKEKLHLSSGLFEGRFTQFIPHWLLTDGQILPIINNFLGFAFLTLGLWLLAKYWNIPKKISLYTIFITFFATLPYTLSWMYFTFITISCLLWVMVAILGLYLSQYITTSSHKLFLTVISVLCFYVTLGGYPPIINTFFVCLSAKITFDYLFENNSLKKIFKTHLYTLGNIIIAAILFKLTLHLIEHNNVYNLQSVALSDMPQKFLETIFISLKQFTLSLPFMEAPYKMILLIMVIFAFVGAIIKAPNLGKKALTILFILGTVWFASLTTFLVVPHTEYVARIDFYGLAFVYTFALALLLKFKTPLAKSLSLIFVLIIIPFNILNDYRALKIWKQGFDAEMQILDNVTERIENSPKFNPDNLYRVYQAGDISLRPSYYKKDYAQPEVFSLDLPYFAMWQTAPLLEFFSPFKYADHNTPLLLSDITPDVKDFIKHKARPWPHRNAVYVDENIIIIILSEPELQILKEKLSQL